MKKKKPPDFHQRSPSTRSIKYMRIRNTLEMRQPAVIVLRTLDPWLCVPAFQRVCLYIRYVYFSFSTIFTFAAIVNRIFAFFRLFSFLFQVICYTEIRMQQKESTYDKDTLWLAVFPSALYCITVLQLQYNKKQYGRQCLCSSRLYPRSDKCSDSDRRRNRVDRR